MVKKSLVVLVLVALVLVSFAVSLYISDSSEISTKRPFVGEAGTGKVGVTVLPTEIEDKMSEMNNG